MKVCRVCGCTEDHACFDEIEQQPCSWAEEDLCTVCVAWSWRLPGCDGLSVGDELSNRSGCSLISI